MRRRLIPIAACLLIAACAAIFLAGRPAFSGSPSADTLLPARTAILPPNGLLQEGDWVFRHGTATDSRLIRELSRSRFSHIGIVVQTQPEVWIAHATTDDDPAHPNQIIESDYAAYTAPAIADKTAVARPAFLSADERRAIAAQAAARLGEPFRLVPREKNPNYCTTLIHDALTILRPDLHARWRHIDLPLLGGDYLFPQALGELPGIQWLTAP